MRGDGVTIVNVGCDTINNVSLIINGLLTDYDLTSPLNPGEAAIINYDNLENNTRNCVTATLENGQSSQICTSVEEATIEAGFGEACTNSTDCDDSNPCTNNTCVGGLCSYPAFSPDGEYPYCNNTTGCTGTGNVTCYCSIGSCIDSCGDATCQSWESESNCYEDCGPGVCGDHVCDYPLEDAWNCFDDCGLYGLTLIGSTDYDYDHVISFAHLISGERIIGNNTIKYDAGPNEMGEAVGGFSNDRTGIFVFSENVTSAYEFDLFKIDIDDRDFSSPTPVFTTPTMSEELVHGSNYINDTVSDIIYKNCSCGAELSDCCDLYRLEWSKAGGLTTTPERLTSLNSTELNTWVVLKKSSSGERKLLVWVNDSGDFDIIYMTLNY
jgi:hypothetical protein